MSAPLVSVVVPVFNGERFLGAALDSVGAQSYEPLEVIVVDDGSTDRSAAIARSRGARVIARPHGGVSLARNAGAAAAAGELLGFLDADDLWTADALSAQVAYLLAHADVGFVVGQMRIVVEAGTRPPPWYRREWEHRTVPSALPLVHRRVFGRVGGFDPTYRTAEDLDWLARARQLGVRHTVLPDLVRIYRLHDTNATYDQDRARSDSFRVLRQSLARRRSPHAAARDA